MSSSGPRPAVVDATAALIGTPGLPRADDGPVFRAPWEAQAFALALALHERGTFTWTEWTHTLAAVIGEVQRRGEADTGEYYYRHWLTALERIASGKGLVTAAALSHRRQEWAEAARHTPHGQPIALARRTSSLHNTGDP